MFVTCRYCSSSHVDCPSASDNSEIFCSCECCENQIFETLPDSDHNHLHSKSICPCKQKPRIFEEKGHRFIEFNNAGVQECTKDEACSCEIISKPPLKEEKYCPKMVSVCLSAVRVFPKCRQRGNCKIIMKTEPCSVTELKKCTNKNCPAKPTENNNMQKKKKSKYCCKNSPLHLDSVLRCKCKAEQEEKEEKFKRKEEKSVIERCRCNENAYIVKENNRALQSDARYKVCSERTPDATTFNSHTTSTPIKKGTSILDKVKMFMSGKKNDGNDQKRKVLCACSLSAQKCRQFRQNTEVSSLKPCSCNEKSSVNNRSSEQVSAELYKNNSCNCSNKKLMENSRCLRQEGNDSQTFNPEDQSQDRLLCLCANQRVKSCSIDKFRKEELNSKDTKCVCGKPRKNQCSCSKNRKSTFINKNCLCSHEGKSNKMNNEKELILCSCSIQTNEENVCSYPRKVVIKECTNISDACFKCPARIDRHVKGGLDTCVDEILLECPGNAYPCADELGHEKETVPCPNILRRKKRRRKTQCMSNIINCPNIKPNSKVKKKLNEALTGNLADNETVDDPVPLESNKGNLKQRVRDNNEMEQKDESKTKSAYKSNNRHFTEVANNHTKTSSQSVEDTSKDNDKNSKPNGREGIDATKFDSGKNATLKKPNDNYTNKFEKNSLQDKYEGKRENSTSSNAKYGPASDKQSKSFDGGSSRGKDTTLRTIYTEKAAARESQIIGLKSVNYLFVSYPWDSGGPLVNSKWNIYQHYLTKSRKFQKLLYGNQKCACVEPKSIFKTSIRHHISVRVTIHFQGFQSIILYYVRYKENIFYFF